MKTKLIFNPPSPDAPGYLRRTKKALEFRQAIESNQVTPGAIDALVDFLLPYVKEPKNRKEAKEALFDATESQFLQLIDVVSGNNDENPSSAQTTNAQSSFGPQE